MRILIFVRHGDYRRNEKAELHLTDEGRTQMLRLAEQIKLHLAGQTVRMLTSTAFRAIESAQVLADEFGLSDFEHHEAFGSDDDFRENDPVALRLIREKSEGVDVLIVVTHMEYAEALPSMFGREVLQARIPLYRPGMGQGRIVFCEDKTDLRIP